MRYIFCNRALHTFLACVNDVCVKTPREGRRRRRRSILSIYSQSRFTLKGYRHGIQEEIEKLKFPISACGLHFPSKLSRTGTAVTAVCIKRHGFLWPPRKWFKWEGPSSFHDYLQKNPLSHRLLQNPLHGISMQMQAFCENHRQQRDCTKARSFCRVVFPSKIPVCRDVQVISACWMIITMMVRVA